MKRDNESRFRTHLIVATTLLLAISLAIYISVGERRVRAQEGTGPGQPHLFAGQVAVENQPAEAGLPIHARIGNVNYAQSVAPNSITMPPTTGPNGTYGQAPQPQFQVCADNPDTPAVEGGVNGDEVSFFVQVDGNWFSA